MKKTLFAASMLAMGLGAGWAQAQTSPVLSWNQTGLDAIARARTTQHVAMRTMAYVSLAQNAVMRESPAGERAEAVATASARVIAELLDPAPEGPSEWSTPNALALSAAENADLCTGCVRCCTCRRNGNHRG